MTGTELWSQGVKAQEQGHQLAELTSGGWDMRTKGPLRQALKDLECQVKEWVFILRQWEALKASQGGRSVLRWACLWIRQPCGGTDC